jgi:Tfp pilus assembly protein PilF
MGTTSSAQPGKTAQTPSPVHAPTASRLKRALPVATLVAFAVLPYLNVLFNGFVYDDDSQVLKNPYVRSFGYLKEIFTTSVWSFKEVTDVTNYYRPMMTLGYLATYKLFGMQAYGFHLVSLLLNVLVVVLVFVLAERLTGDRLAAFVAGALFALHPVHTESVDWIAAVTDLEVTFFYLLTFWFFLAAAKPGGRRSGVQLAAMGSAFVLALLSKEQAMTLPALAAVYEHFYRGDREETSLTQKLARYGLLWLLALAYVLFRFRVFGGLAPHVNHPQLTLWPIGLSAVALVGQYVGKLVWPLQLCAFHVFQASQSFFDFRFLAGLLVLFALGAAFAVCWRSRDSNVRFVSFGIVWFLALLLPVLNPHWVGANVFTERYLYLPSVGVMWLAGLGASKLWSRAANQPARRQALVLAGVVIGGLFAARIVSRNRDWNNDVVLFAQTLEVSPGAYQILNDMGTVYWDQGALDQAEDAWKRSLAINPNNAVVMNNLGMVAAKRKQYTEAINLFQRAKELRPQSFDPYLNLGRVYRVMGNLGLAETELRKALALSPLDYRIRNELGQTLVSEGRPNEAEEQFRASNNGQPNALAYDFLGMLEIRRNAMQAAERDFQAALSLAESDSNAHFGLGYIYKAAGRKTEALSEYQAGLAGDPNNAQALAAVRQIQQQTGN